MARVFSACIASVSGKVGAGIGAATGLSVTDFREGDCGGGGAREGVAGPGARCGCDGSAEGRHCVYRMGCAEERTTAAAGGNSSVARQLMKS
jgi:hypothetical protein